MDNVIIHVCGRHGGVDRGESGVVLNICRSCEHVIFSSQVKINLGPGPNNFESP